LLFVGGIDKRRRRVDDLVAAFNNLKASGHDIQLALVGENFQAPEKIPDEVVRKDVMGSSYAKDILTLGYIDDETKQRLYKEAIAFVFPTIYEGFGIMTLEAMLLECPVIAYSNSSIPEVGGEHVLYAKNWHDIWQQTEKLLDLSKAKRETFIVAAKKHAEQFTWDKTADKIYKTLLGK
jgi:glycosyltransferase involved in cell wall biosynthesis